MKIRTATMDDLNEIANVEAGCFPAAEAATKEEFAGRTGIMEITSGLCWRKTN